MALSVAGLYIYLAEIFKRKKTEPPLTMLKPKGKHLNSSDLSIFVRGRA